MRRGSRRRRSNANATRVVKGYPAPAHHSELKHYCGKRLLSNRSPRWVEPGSPKRARRRSAARGTRSACVTPPVRTRPRRLRASQRPPQRIGSVRRFRVGARGAHRADTAAFPAHAVGRMQANRPRLPAQHRCSTACFACGLRCEQCRCRPPSTQPAFGLPACAAARWCAHCARERAGAVRVSGAQQRKSDR
jgi:hypothetical protein